MARRLTSLKRPHGDVYSPWLVSYHGYIDRRKVHSDFRRLVGLANVHGFEKPGDILFHTNELRIQRLHLVTDESKGEQ